MTSYNSHLGLTPLGRSVLSKRATVLESRNDTGWNDDTQMCTDVVLLACHRIALGDFTCPGGFGRRDSFPDHWWLDMFRAAVSTLTAQMDRIATTVSQSSSLSQRETRAYINNMLVDLELYGCFVDFFWSSHRPPAEASRPSDVLFQPTSLAVWDAAVLSAARVFLSLLPHSGGFFPASSNGELFQFQFFTERPVLCSVLLLARQTLPFEGTAPGEVAYV